MRHVCSLGMVGLVFGLVAALDAPAAANSERIATSVESDTSYHELRVGLGAGVTSAGTNVDKSDENLTAVNIGFVNREELRVLGANLNVQTTLAGQTHGYLGGMYGITFGGAAARFDVMGEGGVHLISGLGSGLFETPTSNSEAVMPYVGAQLRAVFDIGMRSGWQLELSMQGRTDLNRDQRELTVRSCLVGCTTRNEMWHLGGVSANATAGLSFRFD